MGLHSRCKPMNTLSVKVAKKTEEAQDIVSFELESGDGQPLPGFSAGAHIDVHIREGLVRQYSLCNPPGENRRYRIGVLRDPNSRGGSVAIHDEVHAGDLLRISEPRNHFPLLPARHSILVAGGIGVTPLLSMAEHLAGTGASFEMHYCTRSRERTAFHDYIAASPFAGHVKFHFDAGVPDQRLDLACVLARPASGVHLYVCGPNGFIEHVLTAARSLGWAEGQLHVEYFKPHPQDVSGDDAFEIQIASTGEKYEIPPGQPITAVLASHGIDIPVSCEQGICGTCVTRVLQGTPDHRDIYFSDEEHARNDQLTPCCSRAKSRILVLDL